MEILFLKLAATIFRRLDEEPFLRTPYLFVLILGPHLDKNQHRAKAVLYIKDYYENCGSTLQGLVLEQFHLQIGRVFLGRASSPGQK